MAIRVRRVLGVQLIFDPERYPLSTPNMGPPAAGLFPWDALLGQVQSISDELRVGSHN